MAGPKARKGDFISISCPHGAVGVITGCSSTVFDNGPGAARLGDSTVCCSCGMSGSIVTGSGTVFNDGIAAARVNDATVGTCNPGCPTCPHSRSGTINSGSPTTHIDEG